MSIVIQPAALDLVLPWQPNEEQERRFKRVLRAVLILLLIVFVVVPFLPLLEIEHEEEESDIVVTKVLLDPIKPPPQKIVDRPLEIKPQTKPVEEIPKPKDIVKPEEQTAAIKLPSKRSTRSSDKTRVKAKKVDKKVSIKSTQGLDQLSDQLSQLRGTVNVKKLQNKNVSNDKVGSVARSSQTTLGGNQATRRSGGINVDGNLLQNSSTSLVDHTTTAIDGLVEGGAGVSGNQSYSSAKLGKRDIESIRRVLERAKSNVQTLYQRSLLENPGLEGKFVFRLWIEPDGSVSKIQLISSGLNKKDLERKMLARVKRLNFGREDVSRTAVNYTYNFLPS